MGRYGLTTFHLIDTDNVDSAFSPEAIRPCVPMHSEEHPTSAPFWVRPDSNFGLFCNNDVYQQFRFLSHIIFACSLTVSLLTVLRLPRGCRSFSFRERATVSRSVSSWALLTTLSTVGAADGTAGPLIWRTINQVTCVSHKAVAITMQNVPLPSHHLTPSPPLYLHVLSISSILF